MPYSAGQAAFKLTFEISAVTLSGGIASQMVGGMLPLMTVLGGSDAALDDAFGYFHPLPNTALILQQVGHYPFANLSIAANAQISEPLPISLLFTCPVRDAGGYSAKLATMTALQNTLKNHIASGGTFNVATPSFFFNDLILLGLHDVTGDGNQPQVQWKWDFEKPLITIADATATQNQLMSQIGSGLPTDGQQSGAGAVGSPSGAAPQGSSDAAATPSAGLPSYANTGAVPSFAGTTSIAAFSPTPNAAYGTL